jgi:hypothetical protein
MSANWTSSYQGLSGKAAEAYTRYVSRSQELMARIQRGHLPSTALQAHLPRFLQDRGARLHADINRLSFEYLSGLLDLQARYSERYFRGLLPDLVPPEPRPARNGEVHDWSRWYQELNARTAEHGNLAVDRYQRLLERISQGQLETTALQDYSRSFTQLTGSEYSREVAELNFRLFSGLVELCERYNEELFESLLSVPDQNGADGTEPAVPVYLDMVAPVGEVATASLVIENTNPQPAPVTCTVSEFRNTDGTGPAFRASLEIEPAALTLAPQGSHTLSLRLQLDPTQFSGGKTYAATLTIECTGQPSILAFVLVKPAIP